MNRADTLPRPLLSTGMPRRHTFPTGSYAYMITGDDVGQSLDPVIQIDHFHMAHPTFPPHPHAGMSAVTYMLDDAATGFINRDSLGDRSEIRPGDLHWTQAGRGMLHEEIPQEPGKWAHGLQIFVNLAARHKQAPPRAFRLAREERPQIILGGTRILVVTGELLGRRSPISDALLTELELYDIRMSGEDSVDLPLRDPGASCLVLVLAGSLWFGDEEVVEGMVAHFGRADGDSIRARAGPGGAWWILLSGPPLDEPIAAHGPFVGNSGADIAAYLQRYRDGDMGTLAPSF